MIRANLCRLTVFFSRVFILSHEFNTIIKKMNVLLKNKMELGTISHCSIPLYAYFEFIPMLYHPNQKVHFAVAKSCECFLKET